MNDDLQGPLEIATRAADRTHLRRRILECRLCDVTLSPVERETLRLDREIARQRRVFAAKKRRAGR
jgi:hypothetical protein